MDMERVIGAALAGDQQAIDKLYNAYSHRVLGICYNIVGNSIYSQGFFQEITTFINAIECKRTDVLTDLQSIESTLKLIDEIIG